MRAVSALAIPFAAAATVFLGTVFLGLATPALADDPFGTAIPTASLDSQRGGQAAPTITNSADQTNMTSQSSSNVGNLSLKAQTISADLTGTAVNGNSGITTVLLNTGNQVNLSNATNVNVYMTSK